jgi:hypothetical protein
VLFALSILRRNNTQMTLRESGQSAELLTRET